MHKNKLMNQMVNNNWLTQNWKSMLRTKNKIKCNPMIRFSKYVVMLILSMGFETLGYNKFVVKFCPK